MIWWIELQNKTVWKNLSQLKGITNDKAALLSGSALENAFLKIYTKHSLKKLILPLDPLLSAKTMIVIIKIVIQTHYS